mmetsp:Transcript_47853/g.133425  ORF Transcript_47853/g.133425 Transcript_47853/m.133425 type:complete len:208 (-) Transcript_47853:396-1019(-)
MVVTTNTAPGAVAELWPRIGDDMRVMVGLGGRVFVRDCDCSPGANLQRNGKGVRGMGLSKEELDRGSDAEPLDATQPTGQVLWISVDVDASTPDVVAMVIGWLSTVGAEARRTAEVEAIGCEMGAPAASPWSGTGANRHSDGSRNGEGVRHLARAAGWRLGSKSTGPAALVGLKPLAGRGAEDEQAGDWPQTGVDAEACKNGRTGGV